MLECIDRLLSIIRVMIIKLFNFRSLIINKKFYKIYIRNMDNFNIVKGKIILKGSVNIKKNSRLAVNKGGKITIGDGCFLNTNVICACRDEIEIGNNVSFGPNVCIYDHDHSYDANGKIDGKFKTGKVVIGNNVWIGCNVTILRNTIIGDNCVIGAGTIVKGEIPSHSLVTNDRILKIKELKDKI